MNNQEAHLYPEIETWLKGYLQAKYPKFEIQTTHESSRLNLEVILQKFHINPTLAIGLNIKIDIVGILKQNGEYKLAFIEVKDNELTLKDLGQLWGYSQLMDPIESFLFSSKGLGGLSKLLNVLKREDLLKYGPNKNRLMQIAKWDISRKSVDQTSLTPKL